VSYRADTADLARTLGELLTEGGRVPPGDLPAPLCAHTATIGLLIDVHRDITHASAVPVQPHIAQAERQPIALLGRLLGESPRISDQPVIDALRPTGESAAGERWRAVTRAATLAQHAWTSAEPRSRPTGDAAWSELADVAALAEGLAVLRHDLADSLIDAGRLADADTMRRAAQSGLRIVAAEVRHLAATGRLPVAADLIPPIPTRVLIVASPCALPESFRRLGAMLRTVQDISPAHVELVARAAARGAIGAGHAFERAGDSAGAKVLTEHGRRLATTMGGSRRLASIAASDPRPLAQAQQIYEYLASIERRARPLTAGEARAYARHIPDVTRALAEAAQAQVLTGRWLAPADTTGAVNWTTGAAPKQAANLIHRLQLATAQGNDVTRNLAPPTPEAAATLPPPRETLTAALASRRPAPLPTPPHDRPSIRSRANPQLGRNPPGR